MVAYDMGLDEIQADGSLPQEMNRGQMALHYHLYALGPLSHAGRTGRGQWTPFVRG